jgi:hypothetical protein
MKATSDWYFKLRIIVRYEPGERKWFGIGVRNRKTIL